MILAYKELIFTRVEHEFSPKGFSGFQTVYQSESLENWLADEVAQQLYRFDWKEDNSQHLFCKLSSSDYLVSLTTGINNPPKFMDPSMRPGAFIAHAVIFSESEFKKIRYNPFVFFEGIDFIKTPDALKMFLAVNKKSKDISDYFITRSLGQEFNLPADTLFKLTKLSISNKQNVNKKKTLNFIGTSREVYKIIKELFYVLPFDVRKLFSFTTQARANREDKNLWAIGSIKKIPYQDIVVIKDIQNFPHTLFVENLPENFYLNWLNRVSKIHNSEKLLRNAEDIQLLSKQLTHKDFPEEYFALNIDPQSIKIFIKENNYMLKKELSIGLQNFFDRKTVEELIKFILVNEDAFSKYIFSFHKKEKTKILNELIFRWLSQEFVHIDKRQFNSIKKYCSQYGDKNFEDLLTRKQIE